MAALIIYFIIWDSGGSLSELFLLFLIQTGYLWKSTSTTAAANPVESRLDTIQWIHTILRQFEYFTISSKIYWQKFTYWPARVNICTHPNILFIECRKLSFPVFSRRNHLTKSFWQTAGQGIGRIFIISLFHSAAVILTQDQEWLTMCTTIILLRLGGERNRNKEFRFQFRHCRYRNSGRKKTENL